MAFAPLHVPRSSGGTVLTMNQPPLAAVVLAAHPQLPGHRLCRACRRSRRSSARLLSPGGNPNEIALTYDDGPNDIATERLLEVLARHDVRAYVFSYRPICAAAAADCAGDRRGGHLVGNHTMTHPWLAWQSAARIREELAGCNAALEDTLGATDSLLSAAPWSASAVCAPRCPRAWDLTPVQWNVMPKDWGRHRGGDDCRQRSSRRYAQSAAGRGSNILLHDGGDRVAWDSRAFRRSRRPTRFCAVMHSKAESEFVR